MGDTTFDVKLHLGQGVTKLPGDCKVDDYDDNSDPNKVEVPCSFGLMFGISFSIFLVLALTVIMILYLFCQLGHQQEDVQCYYKQMTYY